jgi:non-ribosomal peptide synthetase component F
MELQADREFWCGALGVGGFTAIPRWTLDPAPGTAEHEAKILDELVATLRRLADELAVTASSVLLAAHVRVLSALSGEREVTTGYVARAGGGPLLCRLTTQPGSWRELLLDTYRAESQLLSHADFPVADLRHELGLTEPAFETVFDPTGADGVLSGDIVLWVGIVQRSDELILRLRYQTEVLDADCAARIAGYHLAALELMAADMDAGHRRQSLLSAEEAHFQLEELAGPRRELPDARAGSSSRCRRILIAWPPCAATAASHTDSSTAVPTGWRGRCWLAGWAVRVWWRWWRSATWTGWPLCSRS